MTQLKEYILEKKIDDEEDLYSGYIFVGVFNDFYKYLINFDSYFHRILKELNVFTQDDEVYLNGGELIITYKTSTLELPDFFEFLPSLKLIVIYLYVKDDVEIKNTIPKSLMSKCLIKVVVANLFQPSKLNNLPFTSLNFKLDLGKYYEMEVTVPTSLIKKFNIENKIKLEYPSLSGIPEEIVYSNDSFGRAILFFNNILAKAHLSQVEYINSAVDVMDYAKLTKLPNLKYFIAYNFFKIDSIFTLKNLEYLEIHSRPYENYSLENAFIGFNSLKILKLSDKN